MTGLEFQLRRAVDADLPELMRWFNSAAEVRDWGGPAFGFPYTTDSFREESLWHKLDGFSLCDTEGRLCGFGQLYDHIRRVHLARIAVCPDLRGQGIGRRLVLALLDVGRSLWPYPEASLYVWRDNATALACYLSAGFQIADTFPPERAEFADSCWFLTRNYDDTGTD